MRTRAGWLLGAVIGVGCSAPATPSAVLPDGGSTGDDGGVVKHDAAPNPEGGGGDAAGDARADGSTDSGGADVGPAEDGSPPASSICDPTSTWTALTRVPSIAATGFDRFGAVSSGGTTVAWTTSAGQIYVADRTSTTAAFGTPALLDPGTTQLSNGRVALNPLGLKLVATLASGTSFVSFVRTSVGAAWTLGTGNEFSIIAVMEGAGSLSEPVLGVDDTSLFYLAQTGTSPPVLAESIWDPSFKLWAAATDLPNAEFVMTPSQLRRPTGASSDRQTLFFFDEIAGHERAAWRNSASQPFDYFSDLPSAPEAAPDSTCSLLYFHGSDASGQGLFTAQ